MYQATIKHRLSKIDQENVLSNLEKWKKENPADNFFFRPYELNPDDNGEQPEEEDFDEDEEEGITITEQSTLKRSLLFVHQSVWQRQLLAKYGNSLCLLDATYKTTKYALPLFFTTGKYSERLRVLFRVEYCTHI